MVQSILPAPLAQWNLPVVEKHCGRTAPPFFPVPRAVFPAGESVMASGWTRGFPHPAPGLRRRKGDRPEPGEAPAIAGPGLGSRTQNTRGSGFTLSATSSEGPLEGQRRTSAYVPFPGNRLDLLLLIVDCMPGSPEHECKCFSRDQERAHDV